MKKNSGLGGDVVRLTASKMIVMFISLVSGMLLSRFRTVEEYGTYSQITMVITLATTIFMMGLPNSLNYFLARADTEQERGRFLSVYYTFCSVLSIVEGLFLVLIVPILVDYFDNPLIKDFLFFIAVFPWTKIIMSSIENFLVVYKKSNLIMAYRWLNSSALLLIIIIVKIFSWTFNIYMLLYVLVECLFTLWVYYIVKKNTDFFKVLTDFRLIKKILVFSVPIGLASMVGTLNAELDKFVIGGLMNTEKMAVYTIAAREMPVTIISASITAVLLPPMARMLKNNEIDSAKKLWSDSTWLSFTIMCFIAFVLIVFAPEIITILYSEKYITAVPVFRVYSLTLLFRCTYFGMVLNSSGKTKFVLYSSICTLISNLVLNYSLFYIFGFIGPAIATFISVGIMVLAQLFWSSKILKVKLSKLFEWRSFGVSLLINAILSIIVFCLKEVIPLEKYIGEIFESIILGVFWVGAFLALQFTKLKNKWYALKS